MLIFGAKLQLYSKKSQKNCLFGKKNVSLQMEISYKDNKIAVSFESEKNIKMAYGDRAKKINQRLNELKAAEYLNTIALLPSARLHQLQGNKAGIWSINVSPNYRMLFEITDDPIPILADGGINLAAVKAICIISIEDTH